MLLSSFSNVSVFVIGKNWFIKRNSDSFLKQLIQSTDIPEINLNGLLYDGDIVHIKPFDSENWLATFLLNVVDIGPLYFGIVLLIINILFNPWNIDNGFSIFDDFLLIGFESNKNVIFLIIYKIQIDLK